MSGGIWVTSYVLLWVAVVGLSLAVVVLLRQIGVLHARLHPMGVHFAGEGPPLGEPAPLAGPFDYDSPLTLVAFTSPSCPVCETLKPGLRAIDRQYRDVRLVELEASDDTKPTFRSFRVSNTPYVVAVDREGVVRGRGVANSLDQIEELVDEVLGGAAAVEL